MFQGLAHKSGSGEVVVSCHCGKDPYYFAAVLVHETTHGFNHRYKSAPQLPSWLDEGIADWTAMTVVHNNTAVLRKVQVGVAQAKQQGNLGGNFFTADHIDRWQYGIASSMVDFLLKSNGKAFRKMLDSIKLVKWQDALKDAYGVTPAELTAAYGRRRHPELATVKRVPVQRGVLGAMPTLAVGMFPAENPPHGHASGAMPPVCIAQESNGRHGRNDPACAACCV